MHSTDAASQLQLKFSYRNMAASGSALPALDQVGFKAFSQTDEDGILLYIFSIIGDGNKQSVEVCAGDGMECNTANLIINHGWHGLLVDGTTVSGKAQAGLYRTNPHTYTYPPKFIQAWITRDNINGIISDNGFEGKIDLLSLDMDGVDYWIWDAIKVIDPRVVVVEYQDIIGPDRSLTVPYSDNFNAYQYPTTHGTPNFCGASLSAFTKLAEARAIAWSGATALAITPSS